MELSKLPILLDLDQIVVDMLPGWLDEYSKRTGEKITLDDITTYWIRKLVSYPDVIDDILHEEGFFLKHPPMPGVVKYLTKLIKQEHNIVIVTRSPRKSEHAFVEKRAWVRKYFPDFPMENIIFSGLKELIRGSLLFDDCPDYLESWSLTNPGGITATIDHPYNKDTYCDWRYYKETAWEDFYEDIVIMGY